MTPPAFLALGAGTLVCVLTASASFLGWPHELHRPRQPGQRLWPRPRSRPPGPSPRLTAAEAEALLALIPAGALVRLEAVDEADAMAYARAAQALLAAEGRLVEDATVFTVRGVHGTSTLHFHADGRHGLLVMQRPGADGRITLD